RSGIWNRDLSRGSTSGQNLPNHAPVHVGQTAVDAVVAEGQPGVVDAEQVKGGSVEVVPVGRVKSSLVRPLVAGTMSDTAFDAAAGQPGGEGRGVVVAPLAA